MARIAAARSDDGIIRLVAVRVRTPRKRRGRPAAASRPHGPSCGTSGPAALRKGSRLPDRGGRQDFPQYVKGRSRPPGNGMPSAVRARNTPPEHVTKAFRPFAAGMGERRRRAGPPGTACRAKPVFRHAPEFPGTPRSRPVQTAPGTAAGPGRLRGSGDARREYPLPSPSWVREAPSACLPQDPAPR